MTIEVDILHSSVFILSGDRRLLAGRNTAPSRGNSASRPSKFVSANLSGTTPMISTPEVDTE